MPLFLRKDWEELVASKPTFDARGLVPPALAGAPTAPKPVEVSSDESRGGEEEEVDSEKTLEEVGETSPLSKAEILRALPDDAEADACQEEREQPLITTRGKSSLVPRDVASIPTPPGAGSGSASAGARVPTPQVPMLVLVIS